ncbi:acyl carrier protein [Mycoavidus sp. SF9855]|uniref:acyl carrier protein n=1 Tax=Mycoavidus sp. SF9855 TaxID=2968475 RepID=UPI00211C23EA|nr:acyl carrier protein [Mycoavidus sp. SF9855]UUM21294.1 acyl carrier protein [Mycoavidus sp. SF9855]
MNSVEKMVKLLVAEGFDISVEEIKNEASFIDDLGIDPEDFYELIGDFEDTFGIEIPDEDVEKLKTVQQAVDYIQEAEKNSEIEDDTEDEDSAE